jgi:hypothetical protein
MINNSPVLQNIFLVRRKENKYVIYNGTNFTKFKQSQLNMEGYFFFCGEYGSVFFSRWKENKLFIS